MPQPRPTLADLFHRRWAVPVLAQLHLHTGAKFATLVHATGATPASIRQTLDHLIALGWVAPNPGYGHPLRPEYILTVAGQHLAPGCVTLDAALVRCNLRDIGLRKWTMPTLAALAHGSRRFHELAASLGTVTDRALSLSLSGLAGVPLVGRTSPRPGVPVAYRTIGRGRSIAPIAAEIQTRLRFDLPRL